MGVSTARSAIRDFVVRWGGFREPSHRFVLGWAWASVVANSVIVLTGGVVRLTGSGLGCPEWPKCTEDSFVPHSELGIHGVIEFGNRLLTYVLIAVAIATFVAVWRWSGTTRFARRLAAALALGIPLQGVIGGITVLTDLNPWIVSLHLILSMILIAGSILLVRTVATDRPANADAFTARLVFVAYVALWAVIYVGTIVTGSGPHAGDANSPRNGLDPELWSRFHAALVWLLLGVTALVVWRLWHTTARGAAVALLAAELAQGLIGYVQYFTDLPIALVAAHLVGAAVLVALGTRLLLAVRPVASDRSAAEPRTVR